MSAAQRPNPAHLLDHARAVAALTRRQRAAYAAAVRAAGPGRGSADPASASAGSLGCTDSRVDDELASALSMMSTDPAAALAQASDEVDAAPACPRLLAVADLSYAILKARYASKGSSGSSAKPCGSAGSSASMSASSAMSATAEGSTAIESAVPSADAAILALAAKRDEAAAQVLAALAQRNQLQAEVDAQDVANRAKLRHVRKLLATVNRADCGSPVLGSDGDTQPLAETADDAQALTAAYAFEKKKITILCAVLLGLILQSGIDWSADEKLCRLVMAASAGIRAPESGIAEYDVTHDSSLAASTRVNSDSVSTVQEVDVTLHEEQRGLKYSPGELDNLANALF